MITYENFTKKLIEYFPDFGESSLYTSIFPDGGFDEPYFVCSNLFDWYVKKNKFLFFYKKEINKLFLFCNDVYKDKDEQCVQIIHDAVFKSLFNKPILRKIAKKVLFDTPREDLQSMLTQYEKDILDFK